MRTTAQIDNDGFIQIGGYFINIGTSEGFINRNNKGELLLKRTATPTFISGNMPLYFEKLTLDNPQNIDYGSDIFIENELEFSINVPGRSLHCKCDTREEAAKWIKCLQKK